MVLSNDEITPGGSEATGAAARIDRAWRVMRAESAGGAEESGALDAATAAFMDTILAEFLICPVWDEDGEPPAAPERAQPKLIPTESGEALALFDSEDRLASFLDEPSAFIALPGRDFFVLAAQHGLAVAFNPEVAESAMTFAPATVAAIAELANANEEESEIVGGAAMQARAPAAAPEALLTALGARIAAAQDLLVEGWLFDADFREAPSRLVLGVVAESRASDEAVARLASELSRLGAAVLNDNGAFSVAVFGPGDAILARIRNVGFGLIAAEAQAAAG